MLPTCKKIFQICSSSLSSLHAILVSISISISIFISMDYSFKQEMISRPSFFKLLLKESADYLPLPTAFAKTHLQRSINNKQTLVLEGKKSGVKWRVKCLLIEDRYYFMDGWLKFMKDNRIQMGDFLVFWLLSSSIFQVCIYAPNGCRRVPPTGDDKSLKKPLIKVKKEEEICDDKSLKKPLMVKVKKEEERGGDDDLIENDCRSMIKVIKKSHIYKMPMKKSFWKSVRIDGYCRLRLKNDDGKIWQVKVRKYGEEETLYVGWFDFRKDNKMKIGDTCEFNHVKGNLIHVHVFRKPQ